MAHFLTLVLVEREGTNPAQRATALLRPFLNAGKCDGFVWEDVVPVDQAVDGPLPFAVVTPDGRWHEREGSDAGWQADVRALAAGCPGHLAVTFDCHS